MCLRLAPFWGGEAERDSPGLSSCEEEQQNLPRGARRPALGSLRGCPRPCTQASCPPLPNAASCGQRKGGRGASHLGTQLQVVCGARSLSHGPTRQPPPWEQAPGGRPCSWGRERRQLVTRPGLASADCGARLPRNTAFSAGNRGRSQRGGAGHRALCPGTIGYSKARATFYLPRCPPPFARWVPRGRQLSGPNFPYRPSVGGRQTLG